MFDIMGFIESHNLKAINESMGLYWYGVVVIDGALYAIMTKIQIEFGEIRYVPKKFLIYNDVCSVALVRNFYIKVLDKNKVIRVYLDSFKMVV